MPLATVAILLVALPIAVVVAVFADWGDDGFVRRLQVAGASMEPTLKSGDTVEVFEYGNASPQRRDIIFFAAPLAPERGFISRIVGLPGEVIEITDEEVVINGEAIEEPYAAGRTICLAREADAEATRVVPPLLEGETTCSRKIQSGMYFVMGDNRQNSSDSRQGWLVPEENIVGWVEE